MNRLLHLALVSLISIPLYAQTEWEVCEPPVSEEFEAVYMPEPNKFLVGGAGGILLMTTDMGETFETIELTNNTDVSHIQFFDAQNGYILQDAEILKTTDGGYTWEFISAIPGNVRGVHFVDMNVGYAACDDGEAFRTSDGAQSWELLQTGTSERLFTAGFKNASEGLFGGKDGVSLYTNDQGGTFTPGVIPTDGDISAIQYAGGSTVFSAGEGTIFYSGDDGLTWQPQTVPVEDIDFTDIHFSDQMNGWSVGAEGTILRTSDGGTTWISDISNTDVELTAVHLVNSTQGVAVGIDGVILRMGDNTTGIGENLAGQSSVLKVYPNPVSSDFTISAEFKGNVSIIDLTGREVFRSENRQEQYNLNAGELGLQPGLYICRFTAGMDSHSARLVIR